MLAATQGFDTLKVSSTQNTEKYCHTICTKFEIEMSKTAKLFGKAINFVFKKNLRSCGLMTKSH